MDAQNVGRQAGVLEAAHEAGTRALLELQLDRLEHPGFDFGVLPYVPADGVDRLVLAGAAELRAVALVDELARVRDVHGRPRQFANHPAERARKAVTARVRDAIRKLEPLLPDLAAHLQRTIVTGTYCRYRGDHTTAWDIDTEVAQVSSPSAGGAVALSPQGNLASDPRRVGRG